MKELYKLTNELKNMIEDLQQRYLAQEGPENRSDHDFFQKVKAETTPMFRLNEKWLALAVEFVKDREVKVHPNQVNSTHENIELLILHSYYIDVKRKRYNELNQSVHYVLDMIINEYNNQKRDH